MKNSYYKNKKILVTGAAGFIASNLIIKLVRLGAEVIGIDSMIEGYGNNIFNLKPIEKKIKLNFSDIRDTNSLPYLLKDIDIIFALAGQISHINSMKDPFTDLKINASSQLSLLEALRKIDKKPKIIFASTRQIYGKPQYLPVDENHPLRPVDINGIHKLAAEQYYILYSKVYDFKTVVLRLTNTYGERMMIKNHHQGFLPIWIGQALLNEKIKIFGAGSQLRDFNYIEDVVKALMIAGENNDLIGQVFNLGHHNYYSLSDVIKIINKYIKVKYELIPFPKEKKKIDIGDFYSNYSLFHSKTNWKPKVDLEQGIKKTISYYKKYGKYYLKPKNN